MKKSVITVLVAVGAACLVSCSITATLYPVKGELSQRVPLPVLKATVYGVMGNSGKLTLTMPTGEKCVGRWSSLAPQRVIYTTVSGTVNTPISNAVSTVYGTGVSVGNVPGVNKGTAFLTGPLGTTVDVEFWTGSGTASGNGVAVDNKGNIYKVIF